MMNAQGRYAVLTHHAWITRWIAPAKVERYLRSENLGNW